MRDRCGRRVLRNRLRPRLRLRHAPRHLRRRRPLRRPARSRSRGYLRGLRERRRRWRLYISTHRGVRRKHRGTLPTGTLRGGDLLLHQCGRHLGMANPPWLRRRQPLHTLRHLPGWNVRRYSRVLRGRRLQHPDLQWHSLMLHAASGRPAMRRWERMYPREHVQRFRHVRRRKSRAHLRGWRLQLRRDRRELPRRLPRHPARERMRQRQPEPGPLQQRAHHQPRLRCRDLELRGAEHLQRVQPVQRGVWRRLRRWQRPCLHPPHACWRACDDASSTLEPTLQLQR